MHQVKYGLFYDNHTHMENPDVGKDFDPEYFIDQIKRCGVDYLAFHARCNVGMAYYDTKIGIKHPSLTYDLFGKLAELADVGFPKRSRSPRQGRASGRSRSRALWWRMRR